MKKGFVVLESGETFQGNWLGGRARAGEIVFNTSHNGYEEIATDPSYFGQIMLMSAPQQGNYGVDNDFWESRQLWIQGFVCLEMKKGGWQDRLNEFDIPSIDGLDTRNLVLSLRDRGTQVGALVDADNEAEAIEKSKTLIADFKSQDKDWAHQVSYPEYRVQEGSGDSLTVAVVDFGCKENILRELKKRCKEVHIFPSRSSAQDILAVKPDGILLSNGPGNPEDVQGAADTVRELVGQKPIFGICMGHQILARALGGETYKLKFGHRGANHPVKNILTGEICVTSQNHGYAIANGSLPREVKVTHVNLNDQTVSGLEFRDKKCFSVQFHPESHPGPRDAEVLFDQFIQWMQA